MKKKEIKEVSEEQKKEDKLQQAIAMLNDLARIKLAPSPIDGVGVFAISKLNKGEHIYADAIPNLLDIPFDKFDQLRPEVAELILGQYPLIASGSHFLYPHTRMLAYMNHSDTPNYDGVNDKTLRKIKEGEEITEDYRLIPEYQKIYPWLAT